MAGSGRVSGWLLASERRLPMKEIDDRRTIIVVTGTIFSSISYNMNNLRPFYFN